MRPPTPAIAAALNDRGISVWPLEGFSNFFSYKCSVNLCLPRFPSPPPAGPAPLPPPAAPLPRRSRRAQRRLLQEVGGRLAGETGLAWRRRAFRAWALGARPLAGRAAGRLAWAQQPVDRFWVVLF